MVGRIPTAVPLPQRWATWQEEMNRAQKERRPFYVAVALMLVAGVAVAAAARAPDEGAAMAVAVVFAGLVLSCYYWVVLIVLALRRGNGGAVGVLAVNAATLVTALVTSDSQVVFGVFSWAMLALFAALIVPDVARTVRLGLSAPGSGDERGAARAGRTQPVQKSERPGKRVRAGASTGTKRNTLFLETASVG
jgi:FtsH-binding integral membrane protein